jgi:predicted site-specific integrase-resolvase
MSERILRAWQEAKLLLRRRDILTLLKMLGFGECELNSWVQDGLIRPFRKRSRAKAYYIKNDFIRGLFPEAPKLLVPEPKAKLLRRADVLAWLGISEDELDSWFADGLIKPFRKNRRAWKHYRKNDIKALVFGKPTSLDSPIVQENREPMQLFLPRGDVLSWASITGAELDSLVANGWIRTVCVQPNTKRRYLKDDVKRFLEGRPRQYQGAERCIKIAIAS